MTALQPFEYYSHNTNEIRKVQINPHQMEELSHTMAETIVDNMSTKDLVRYVHDDLVEYYTKLSHDELLCEVVNYYDDGDLSRNSYNCVSMSMPNLKYLLTKASTQLDIDVVLQKLKAIVNNNNTKQVQTCFQVPLPSISRYDDYEDEVCEID